MISKYNIIDESDALYFVRRHYQKLIQTTQEPDTNYPEWLGEALTFLVEHLDSFPEKSSYFDVYLYRQILEWLRRPYSTEPSWLADCLEYLVDHIEYFAPPGNEDTYVAEYIYPH